MRLAAALLFLAITTPVLAGTPCTDLVPPAQYRHEPRGAYTVERVSRERLNFLCAGSGARYACSFEGDQAIYIVKALPNTSYLACLLVHEKAHLNGWPASHPMS